METRVQVAVDINFDQTERTSEIYDSENHPSSVKKEILSQECELIQLVTIMKMQ